MTRIDDLFSQGKIRRQRFKPEEVEQTLQRARDELDAAQMVAEKHNESAFELADNAMFLAATALMQQDGLRTAAEGRRTLVEYLEERIGALDMGLVNELDEARKRRNLTFYDRRRITNRELQHMLTAADLFVEFMGGLIVEYGPGDAPTKE